MAESLEKMKHMQNMDQIGSNDSDAGRPDDADEDDDDVAVSLHIYFSIHIKLIINELY